VVQAMDVKKILYITYDGLTDPLGQSQILPYLKGLSAAGYRFTVLSFEKKDRYHREKEVVQQLTIDSGIDWVPMWFTARPPVLSKLYDAVKMRRTAVALHKQKKFAMVHCRSYGAADAGLYLKKKFGIKFLFDMRGFWVDERVDGGAWNLQRPFYRLLYKKYKTKEAAYIAAADGIISLTEAGQQEIESWSSYAQNLLEVIPCSTDFGLFEVADDAKKEASRTKLGIGKEALVFSYLGSIGAWYLLDEMLQLFAQAKKTFPQAIFLFITAEDPALIIEPSKKYGIPASDLFIFSARRNEVPFYIAASDLNIFFIKQSYSKIASSPTKLGEILAMGLPVICNSRIGDVEKIVKTTDAGYVVEDFRKEDFDAALQAIPRLLSKNALDIRNKAMAYYRLDNAIEKYKSVYERMLAE
jgi:glycosyltransferase involved in cell wall biosynthesis